MESSHYNKWLTDNIQNNIINIDERIKSLFENYTDFSKMDDLFESYRRWVNYLE